MTTIKLISVRHTWAHHIVFGEKDVENRTWPTHYRGGVLIHASLKRSDTAPPIPEGTGPMQFGGVIGVARIVDCVRAHSSKWFEGPYGFVLAERRPLSFVSWPGALSLRNAPQELIQRIGEKHLAEYLAA